MKEEDLRIPKEINDVSINKDILIAIKKKVLLDKEHSIGMKSICVLPRL